MPRSGQTILGAEDDLELFAISFAVRATTTELRILQMPHIPKPTDAKSVYLIGICGTAMASLAGMLVDRGFNVTGSDEHVYPPMSTFLEQLGIPTFEGYTTERLRTLRPDLVVIGNAISRSNPEAIETLEMDLAYTSMPEAIYSFFLQGSHSIVITGTHGKTTTASMMAWLLESAGRDPGMMVGGIPENFGQNFKLGNGGHFVIEGDEYNTAFFDRGPKFLHYRANTLLINNIEFDHADIFDDLDSIVRAFRQVVEQMAPEGLIVANGDDEVVESLREHSPCEWLTIGFGTGCDVRISEFREGTGGVEFSIDGQGERWGSFSAPLSGKHNVMNATADIAVARRLGLDADEIRKGLTTFDGIKRRMEVRGVARGITVVDDFAHHPTAVATTLEGARAKFPGARLWVVFEPRSISSARKEFEQRYVEAFSRADRVVIGPVFHRKRFETRYGIEKMMSVDGIVADLRQTGVEAEYVEDFDAIAGLVATEGREGDVVIVMSSGSFGGLHETMLDRLSQERLR